MDNLEKNLTKNSLKDLYDTYSKIISLLNELEQSIKELPPKEEL